MSGGARLRNPPGSLKANTRICSRLAAFAGSEPHRRRISPCVEGGSLVCLQVGSPDISGEGCDLLRPHGIWRDGRRLAERHRCPVNGRDGTPPSVVSALETYPHDSSLACMDGQGRVLRLLSWPQIMRVFHVREGGCPQPPKIQRVRTRALPRAIPALTLSGTIKSQRDRGT